MSAADAGTGGRGKRWSVGAAQAGCAAIFVWAVAQFYQPGTGFTSLISIGDATAVREVAALRGVPHYVYPDSAGYDGAYYVQLALDPTLRNPELAKEPPPIDNLQYRARRILFCWIAWALGLGQPAWIVQAFALLNVASWLALAWVLLRWFPATSWDDFFRWFAVMFSHGVAMSVRDSLVDGPALLLVAVAMAARERGAANGGAALLGLAGLGRETSLLALAGFAPAEGRPRGAWRNFARAAMLAAVPLLAWMAYVRWRIGPADDPGLGNFTLPFAGLAGKWGAALAGVTPRDDGALRWATLAATVALTVQFLFFALRWRPGEAWWRVGAVFAVMMAFLATPVWEGFPGAATRVLLPMTLAFNVLVPRGRAWLPVLLAGNLTVLATLPEFNPPPRDFLHVAGDSRLVAAVQLEPVVGWDGPESRGNRRWRWSLGQSDLRIRNHSGGPVVVTMRGAVAAVEKRSVQIAVADAPVWSGEVATKPIEFQFECTAPPGDTLVRFASDKPPSILPQDPRKLAFNVLNLEVVVKPAAGQR